MLKRRVHVDGARVLILGLTFKENCPDLRNTRVLDVVAELRDYGVHVDVHDPWVDAADVQQEYGLAMVTTPDARGHMTAWYWRLRMITIVMLARLLCGTTDAKIMCSLI